VITGELRFFIDSNFSATGIGPVSIVNAQYDNGGEDFGLYALNTDGKDIRSVKYKDTLSDESWKYPLKDVVFAPPADLVIQTL
ncbi:hypothetical protein LCGC14_2929920, partial [marine sediment metagenome]